MQLQEWANAHKPAEELFFSDGYWEQICFVRDAIPGILAKTRQEYRVIEDNLKVISTHTSKSVRLPVFSVKLADGTEFTMRNNFYNWKVSVSSPHDVEADFMELFNPNPNQRIHEIYCEGFPKELVYGPYVENKRQFTIELPSSNHYLFTFFWIFAHQVLHKRNKDERGK